MGLRFNFALLTIGLLLPLGLHAQEPSAPKGASNTDEEPEVEYFYSAREQVTIGVMEFVAREGVSQGTVETIADIIAEHISKLGDVRVVSKADIISMLNLEKQKRLAGCTDKECFSEIAGALGMPWMVTGNVSVLGESIILNLKLIDVRNAYVAGRATRRIKGDVDDLLDELPDATKELFDRVSERIGFSIPDRITIASRHFQPIGESPSSVWVITREDVEASGATNLPDLLRLVPGMDVVMVSPAYASVSSRIFWNGSNSYYQLLIDGRDCINEILGMVPWMGELVSLEDIERIEILRGPASSMYGASALAGVVSVTTRVVPDKTSASIRLNGGEVGMFHAGGRASTRVGNLGFALYGSADILNSFFDPRSSGKRGWKLRAMTEYELSESRKILLDFGMTRTGGGLNTAIGLLDMTMDSRALLLAYETEYLRARLYWQNSPVDATLQAPLEYNGILLATFIPLSIDAHTVDGEVQWILPELTPNLLLMVGCSGRVSWIGSDQLLDGDTYADITSHSYHKTGISQWEGRAGTFVHSEYQPAEWVTLSGSLRFDYNTVTPAFLSPRVAAVFNPARGQYLRLGISRAFHKSQFIETGLHPMVDFPDESPITGDGRRRFQEFMSQSIGNSNLINEELLSFEAGYLGQYLDETFSVALDVFFSQSRNGTVVKANIVKDAQGLPDLDRSSILVTNEWGDFDLYGIELVVRYNPSKWISLMASWAHKQVFFSDTGQASDGTPKNLITVGSRFKTESNLVGSFYVFSRSEFVNDHVENPEGLFAPSLTQRMDNVFLIMAKVGCELRLGDSLDVETGLKLFLPFSPFSGPLFSYYEDTGGDTPFGRPYGGEPLRRILTAYLQGSF